MIMRAQSLDQRSSAEIRPAETELLVESILSISVGCATCDSPAGSPIVHLDHTPSPQGQQEAPTSLLPPFSGVCGLGGMTKSSAPSAELLPSLRVVRVSTQDNGAVKCLSETSSSPLQPARVLPRAVTRLPNRASAVPQSVPALRRSPVAVSPKARLLGQRATSPTANSIPAVANPITVARFARRTRPLDPAQRLLSRGFCIEVKTQKDTTCSRKS